MTSASGATAAFEGVSRGSTPDAGAAGAASAAAERGVTGGFASTFVISSSATWAGVGMGLRADGKGGAATAAFLAAGAGATACSLGAAGAAGATGLGRTAAPPCAAGTLLRPNADPCGDAVAFDAAGFAPDHGPCGEL